MDATIPGQRAPSRSRRSLLFAAITVTCCLLVTAAWSSPEARKQISESISRRPASFTELYFTDPDRLPRHLSSRASNQVLFTIVNHGSQAIDYAYVITAQGVRETTTLATGSVHVGAGNKADESVSFRPGQLATTYVVNVALTARPEAIHFTATS